MTATEAARALVAHPRWRWAPGMRAVGRRGLPLAWFRVEEHLPRLTGEWADALPDLDDPATAGVLLSMLAGATDESGASLYSGRRAHVDWYWSRGDRYGSRWGDTLGHAAALALLALWGPA